MEDVECLQPQEKEENFREIRDEIEALKAIYNNNVLLGDEDKETYSSAWPQYKETWPEWQTVEEVNEKSKKEWQVHAAQLTYNCCASE